MSLRRLLPSTRALGLLDQAAFAAWSVLLILWAGRGLPADDAARFSVVYLAMVTAVQLVRPFVAEPLILVRDPQRPDMVLGGGLYLAGLAVAITSPLSLIGLATGRWALVCPAVVTLAVAQDSLRSLAVNADAVSATLASDLVLLVAFVPGVIVATRWELTLASFLGLVEAALVLSCCVTLRTARYKPATWRPGAWWSRTRQFAIGATVGGTIDLFVVNGCFALPAFIGHSAVTASLTAGRTFFAVPTTLLGSWLYAWTWRCGASDTVVRRTATRLMSVSIATTLLWAGLAFAMGRDGLVRLFGTAGAGLRSILVPLTAFYVFVGLSVVAKAVLRVVRQPGRARRASWAGDAALVVVTIALAGESQQALVAGMAFALIPLVVGYVQATFQVVGSRGPSAIGLDPPIPRRVP